MTSILTLKLNARKYARSQISQIHNSMSTFQSLTLTERIAKKHKLISVSVDVRSLNSEIQSIQYADTCNETELVKELDRCNEYDDKVQECLAMMEVIEGSPAVGASALGKHLLKSPVVPLPTYKGNIEESLDKFLKSFQDSISRYHYAEFDKFVLLKQQLSGRALVLVNSLGQDEQSYGNAVALLKEAFASPATQRFNTIKQISQIRLKSGDDPFEYMGKMRQLTESVKLLKIESNEFLQYFYWNGLNDLFRTQVVQITNKGKPSLEELNKHFFEAAERYSLAIKLAKPKETDDKTTNMAVNIETKKVFKCTLCMNDKKNCDHLLSRCPVYNEPALRLEKLKALDGCSKCGSLKHKTNDCKFKFNRRCSCASWHFSFLCPKYSKPTKAKDEIKSGINVDSKVNINTTSLKGVDSFQISYNMSQVILPTFSCAVNDRIMIRALKDEGSQSNFILSSLADELKLPITEPDVKMVIDGFNGPCSYKTKMVKLNLIVGKEVCPVEAVCVPNIRLNVNLPRLSKVTEQFVNKGFALADKSLYEGVESISDLDFVLGSVSAYCLSPTLIRFGKENSSAYIDSSLGVILLGSIDRLLEDIDFLSDAKVTNNEKCKSVTEDMNVESKDFKVSSNFLVVDKPYEISRTQLELATASILHGESENDQGQDSHSELNQSLLKFTLNSTVRQDDGRLLMPLLWRSDVSHLLGHNYDLAKSVLNSNFKKLSKKPNYLSLMDYSFKEQEKLGIIERIPNLDLFLEELPEPSFLPHMGVFRPDRETTKCRVVYLSNLCQKDTDLPFTVSHNQAMHCGPSLNQNISVSLIHLRFDSKLLIFDLRKAFNQIALSPQDSLKLLCLWYRNVANNDFSIVGYRNKRLPFGLRCSPTLLMLGLYRILVIDGKDDPPYLKNLKLLLYQGMYMDNGGVTANDSEELEKAYSSLVSIFKPYQFDIQQCLTNDEDVQSRIDSVQESENTPPTVKLLGTMWDRVNDSLSTKPINLNKSAQTKRTILKSIAEQYDIFNFNAPLMNRARLFLHSLQINKDIQWDDILNDSLKKDWRNIVNQANASSVVNIPRNVGNRDDSYKLIACTDASTQIVGVVIYFHNINTNKVSFVLSRNKIVISGLKGKTVPSLELQAIMLGVETLTSLKKDLSGTDCTTPIKIEELVLYSDSLVALSWLNSYANKFEKFQKKSVFVTNRVTRIIDLCKDCPINFSFISGVDNPADLVTRSVSSKLLNKSNYITGPSFLKSKIESQSDGVLIFVVPNANSLFNVENTMNSYVVGIESDHGCDPLIDLSHYSKPRKLINIMFYVFKFVNVLKSKVGLTSKLNDVDLRNLAVSKVIRNEQLKQFPEVFHYFELKRKRVKDMPNLVRQLNLFVDTNGLLRVKSKFDKMNSSGVWCYPILLPKSSHLTNMFVLDLHEKFKHAGCFTILSELRKRFWVSSAFSIIRKVLKTCIACRRFNGRAVKVNQSFYRDLRVNPGARPFNSIYMDYIGPFESKVNGVKIKVWILCMTCMWSRAISLKLCNDFSTQEFIRNFQLHVFEYGLPQNVVSDLGSQLVAGARKINDYLKDPQTNLYLSEVGINKVSFDQFSKGKSELGSLVETLVKQCKKLIYSSLGKVILDIKDFDLLVHQAAHIINRRPVAFKDALRSDIIDLDNQITPEFLIHGYYLPSVNVIPELHPVDIDPDWVKNDPIGILKNNYSRLNKVNSKLKELYNEEFLVNLISQATDKNLRYKPVKHDKLNVGDIVLLKDDHCKSYNYPMGIIQRIETNALGETTSAVVRKGNTRELTSRHVSNLIPLLSFNEEATDNESIAPNADKVSSSGSGLRLKRGAAKEASRKIREISDLNLV